MNDMSPIHHRRWFVYFVFLFCAHFLSHFYPFERSSLGPDDYANLISSQNVEVSELPRRMIQNSDRPLNYAFLFGQFKIFGDNAQAGLIFNFLSSLILLCLVFLLFCQLMNSPHSAFLGAFIFCLLPHKLETYHYPASVNINLVTSIYILSVICFIRYIQKHSNLSLVISLLCYSIGIFWYEIGFFIPILLVLYTFLFKKRIPWSGFYYGIPMLSYTLYRLTGVFGMAGENALQHKFGFSAFFVTLLDLIHHYFGRYFIRNVLYGFYQFSFIEHPWLLSIIFLNGLILVLFYRFMREHFTIQISQSLKLFMFGFFLITIAPVFLNTYGGIAGRHLLLPSIPVSIGIGAIISKVFRRNHAFLCVIAILLIISQGNGWAQIVSARINGKVYETLRKKKEKLQDVKYVVFDTMSFAKNIPYSWRKNNFDILNTYYGAQTFEDQGLSVMPNLIINKGNPKQVYIAIDTPQHLFSNTITFSISQPEAYRKVVKKSVTVPFDETMVIGFKDVFGNKFQQGKGGW